MKLLRYAVLSGVALTQLFGGEERMIRQTAADQLEQARDWERKGDLIRAERILLTTWRSAEKAGARLEAALALHSLGSLQMAADRYEDAESSFHRARRVLHSLPGTLPALLLRKTTVSLAYLLIEAGRAKELEKLSLRKVLEASTDEEEKARAQGALWGLAMLRREWSTAEKGFAELKEFWLDPRRRAGGQADLAMAVNNLGVIAAAQKREESALRHFEEAYSIWEAMAGPDNPKLAKVLTNMGVVCLRREQNAAGSALLTRAWEHGRRTLGELHPFTVTVQSLRATALQRAGRKAEARQVASAASAAEAMMIQPSPVSSTIDVVELRAKRR